MIVSDSFPFHRGATRGRAIFAGATEGKAIYYGSKLLWNVAGWNSLSIAGLWEFNNSQNISKATLGHDLTIVGSPPAYQNSRTDGQGKTLQGVIVTSANTGNHLLATHSIGANGGGSFVNQYTLLFDFLIPENGQWRNFYQTNLINSNDGNYYVNASNNKVGLQEINYSSTSLQTNQWYRLILSVDLRTGGHFRAYIDGQLFFTHTKSSLDGKFSLDNSFILFFADNNNENQPLVISAVAIFSRALSANEILTLGGSEIPIIAG